MVEANTTRAGAPAEKPSYDFPSDEFLTLLAFNFDEASVWLGHRRMLLVDVSLFAQLRRQIIDAKGVEAARAIFTKIGFDAGYRDAKLVDARWPDVPLSERTWSMSPHWFQGFFRLDFGDIRRDEHNRILEGEWKWHQSAEAAAHIDEYGRASEPTCWMELGYATGYHYGMHGDVLFFQEIACRGMGHECCTIVGKVPELHDDLDGALVLFPFLKQVIPKTRKKAVTQSLPRIEIKHEFDAVPPDTIVGRSPALSAAKQLLESVASTTATVLIQGESGVGKELFTRNLHRLSPRAGKPFVAVNCAAIPDTLIESELFGVERGAFTGATESRPGRFERAHEGTLFLDEIGALNYAAQIKLLRAIQEREVERIGGTKSIKVDVRIVAAHNVSLRALMDRGEFREDLFFRLNVFPIYVPPLRERREDIPELISYYLDFYNRLHRRSIVRFSFEATRALLNYDFPGNIRELQNLVERAVILAKGDEVSISDVFAHGEKVNARLWTLERDGHLHRTQKTTTRSLQDYIEEMKERLPTLVGSANDLSYPDLEDILFDAVVESVLTKEKGNLSAAARRLGMKRHQLEYRIKAAKGGSSEADVD